MPFLKLGDIKGEFASNVSVEAFGTGSAGCQTMPPSEIKTYVMASAFETDEGLIIPTEGDDIVVQPEADGFMKLGDIKGEFASNVSVTYREDGANRFTGKRLNWDAICDVGTSIKQESVADSLTNPDHELGLDVGPVNQGADVWTTGPVTSVYNFPDTSDPGPGSRSNWDVICDVGTAIKQEGIDLQSDALVQQVNGTTGYEMQAGMGISDNRFVSEVVEALTSFGQSSDPALDAAGGFQPREVAAVEIGEPPEPKLWLQMLG